MNNSWKRNGIFFSFKFTENRRKNLHQSTFQMVFSLFSFSPSLPPSVQHSFQAEFIVGLFNKIVHLMLYVRRPELKQKGNPSPVEDQCGSEFPMHITCLSDRCYRFVQICFSEISPIHLKIVQLIRRILVFFSNTNANRSSWRCDTILVYVES